MNESVRRIIAERDMCWDLLVRIAKAGIQQPNNTNNEPIKQTIAVDEGDHRKLQDLALHIALGRDPTPTPYNGITPEDMAILRRILTTIGKTFPTLYTNDNKADWCVSVCQEDANNLSEEARKELGI